MQETPHNRLATWPVQPLRHLSAGGIDAVAPDRIGCKGLKPAERITKRSEAGSRGSRRTRAVLGLLTLAAIIGASYAWYRQRPVTEAQIARIENAIRANRVDEALALMTDALARARDPDALRLRIGRAYLREGRMGPAAAQLSRVEPLLITEERLAVAEYLLVQGDPFNSSRFFEGALRSGATRSPGLLARYGEALSLASNGEAAVTILREALTLDPSRTSVRLNLAITLANLGRLAEAARELQVVQKSEPGNPRALALAQALSAPR